MFVILLLLQALSRSSYGSHPLLSNYSISIHFSPLNGNNQYFTNLLVEDHS